MDIQTEMYLPLDDDGLLRRECPHCEQEFKLFVEDYRSIEQKMYCPICGIPSPVDWFMTKEQVAKAHDVMQNMVMDELNKMFKGMAKSLRQRGNGVTMKIKPLHKKDPRTLVEKSDFEETVCEDSAMSVFVYSPATYGPLYCPKSGDIFFPN